VQALFKANTKAVNLTKKLSAAGFNLSPVKANYSIQKTKVSNVELEEVKIDLMKLPKPKIELPV